MEICIDFDGTCVTHEYPNIGKEIGSVPVLKKLIKNKHNLILFTMRSGKQLEEAVGWFKQNEIPLYGVNINPTQMNWTKSPKAYAHLYIDDAALGIPLQQGGYDEFGQPVILERAHVFWPKVEELLLQKKIIQP